MDHRYNEETSNDNGEQLATSAHRMNCVLTTPFTPISYTQLHIRYKKAKIDNRLRTNKLIHPSIKGARRQSPKLKQTQEQTIT